MVSDTRHEAHEAITLSEGRCLGVKAGFWPDPERGWGREIPAPTRSQDLGGCVNVSEPLSRDVSREPAPHSPWGVGEAMQGRVSYWGRGHGGHTLVPRSPKSRPLEGQVPTGEAPRGALADPGVAGRPRLLMATSWSGGVRYLIGSCSHTGGPRCRHSSGVRGGSEQSTW